MVILIYQLYLQQYWKLTHRIFRFQNSNPQNFHIKRYGEGVWQSPAILSHQCMYCNKQWSWYCWWKPMETPKPWLIEQKKKNTKRNNIQLLYPPSLQAVISCLYLIWNRYHEGLSSYMKPQKQSNIMKAEYISCFFLWRDCLMFRVTKITDGWWSA